MHCGSLSCVAIALASLFVACGPPPPELPINNPRATAVDAIKADPEYCPFKRAEYCLEELVDPAIEKELGSVHYKKLKGQLPTTDRKLARFVKSAKGRYRQLHFNEPAQRDAVLAKMKAHYEDPPMRREGDQVYVDLGVLPTGIQKGLRTGWVLGTTDSPLLDGFLWSGREIAAKFLQAREAHPDAKRFTLRIVVPRGVTTARLVLAWDPAVGQIALKDFMNHWATAPGLGPDLARVRSGEVAVLPGDVSCTPGDGGIVNEACPAQAMWPKMP